MCPSGLLLATVWASPSSRAHARALRRPPACLPGHARLTPGLPFSCFQDLVAFLQKRQGQCGIVYVRLRKTCDDLARHLQEQDVEAAAYHAGLDPSRRMRVRHGRLGCLPACAAGLAWPGWGRPRCTCPPARPHAHVCAQRSSG